MTDYPVLKTMEKVDKDPTEIQVDPIRLGECTIGDDPVDGRGGWFEDDAVLEVRSGGMFANKAFFLDGYAYDWVLGMDDEDHLVLVPLKKEV